jgi:hypothetical protein
MPAMTCAHAACSCPVEAGREFCSEACRQAGDRPVRKQSGCACGHQDCLGNAGRKGDQALRAGKFEPPSGPTAR